MKMTDEDYMRLALIEAQKAFDEGEIPIGAVIVKDEEILASAHNRREAENDPTLHAEMTVIREAAKKLGNWRLTGCRLYVTIEPCPMCAGAVLNARIPTVIWGADNPQAGGMKSKFPIASSGVLNHTAEMIPGVLGEECKALMDTFFKGRRK